MWRSLKYEAVYLHDLADGFQARRVIGEWIDFYNAERPHSALGGKTPAEAYRGDPPADMMDKPLRALPTYPQAQQRRQEDRSKEILARSAATGIHLKQAAKLSTNRGHLTSNNSHLDVPSGCSDAYHSSSCPISSTYTYRKCVYCAVSCDRYCN